MNNENTERIGPDWQPIAEAAREAVETARTALDALARAWAATPGTPATEKAPVASEDVIEQAARVMWEGNDLDRAVLQDCTKIAQALADAGLLARPLPTREEIAEVLKREFWPFLAHDPANPARFWGQSADAVLALLKGRTR